MSNKGNRINIKESIISAVALAVISGGVTAALAATNALTEQTIAKANQKAETESRQQVINADSFEKQSLTDDGQEVVYYKAVKDGELAGYVFTVSSAGKSSGLVVMPGISAVGVISGVTVTVDNETAGYLDMIREAEFFKRFLGRDASEKFYLGKNIDGVSHATKTSKGITEGVNRAVDLFNKYLKGGQEG